MNYKKLTICQSNPDLCEIYKTYNLESETDKLLYINNSWAENVVG